MPSRLPLTSLCGNPQCGHTLNWHKQTLDAPCTVGPCKCAGFVWESASPPLLTEVLQEELKQRLTAGARDSQVGGDHYAKHSIQPWDIWAAYDLNAFEGAVIKYLLRHRDKGGVEDLKKARHTLDRLIEIEEGKARG